MAETEVETAWSALFEGKDLESVAPAPASIATPIGRQCAVATGGVSRRRHMSSEFGPDAPSCLFALKLSAANAIPSGE